MSTRQDALEERLSSLEDKLQGLQVSKTFSFLIQLKLNTLMIMKKDCGCSCADKDCFIISLILKMAYA
jgi:hypothetical protein